MKLAIMQPYFFPYFNYFQLINVVDQFVIYDDVQYIKSGWINRNRILLNDKCFYIRIPVKRDFFKKKINERYYISNSLKFKKKLLLQLYHGYRKAPYFKPTYELIDRLIHIEENNISKFNTFLLKEICNYIGIETPFIVSSELNINNKLTGQDRVIQINKEINSSVYINSLGGKRLYCKDKFKEYGVELQFIKIETIYYKQFKNDFVPNLSIIDLLMFNSIDTIKYMLSKYNLE